MPCKGELVILHIKVCLQVLGSTIACVKKCCKFSVAPEGAAQNLVNLDL